MASTAKACIRRASGGKGCALLCVSWAADREAGRQPGRGGLRGHGGSSPEMARQHTYSSMLYRLPCSTEPMSMTGISFDDLAST